MPQLQSAQVATAQTDLPTCAQMEEMRKVGGNGEGRGGGKGTVLTAAKNASSWQLSLSAAVQ